MKKRQALKRQALEMPNVAAPCQADAVDPGATVAIVVEVGRMSRPKELAIARTSAPYFEILDISHGMWTVAFEKMAGCEDGGPLFYMLTVRASDEAIRGVSQAIVRVRNASTERHAFRGAVCGPVRESTAARVLH